MSASGSSPRRNGVVAPGKLISLNVAGPPIWPASRATACALAANELVLSALEHAFHGRGAVRLGTTDRFGRPDGIGVLDDGVGLPSTGSVETVLD